MTVAQYEWFRCRYQWLTVLWIKNWITKMSLLSSSGNSGRVLMLSSLLNVVQVLKTNVARTVLSAAVQEAYSLGPRPNTAYGIELKKYELLRSQYCRCV